MDREKRRIRRIGGGYLEATKDHQRPILWGLSRCIKANMNDASAIVEYDI